jgi:hypothetical protein
MTNAPPVSRVAWPEARRMISSRYPPVDLFEDIADPRDWELLAAAESKTNPRVAESVGRLDLVPPERRVAGHGASYVMAPFVHVSPDRAGRFHDGSVGSYYAANRFETAVAETAYHKARFFRSTKEAPGWLAQMRELVGAIDNAFHDVRGRREFEACLDPDSYGASQELAAAARRRRERDRLSERPGRRRRMRRRVLAGCRRPPCSGTPSLLSFRRRSRGSRPRRRKRGCMEAVVSSNEV